MASEVPEIPHNMRRLYRRFERWRSAHTGVRLPIPERLWRAATEQARKHGVFPTAKVLRLEYGKLKQLVEAARRTAKGPRVLLNSRQAPGGDPRQGRYDHRRLAPRTLHGAAGVCRAARAALGQFSGMPSGVGRAAREDEDRIQRHRHGGARGAEPGVVG